MTALPARPDVLICAGLDPSGGAGLVADVRVVAELGGRPLGIVTALTVQDTHGMRSCHDLDPEVIGAQLGALLSDIEVRAVKLGLLGSAAVIAELAQGLDLTGAPVVWDPVGGPSRGDPSFRALLSPALVALGRHLALITPNTLELGELAGTPIDELEHAVAAGEALARRVGVAVLVKGGHLAGSDVVDVLCQGDRGPEYLRGPRLGAADVHGTGCALSSAIATYLALGAPMVEACRQAKAYVATLIAQPTTPGRGAPSVL